MRAFPVLMHLRRVGPSSRLGIVVVACGSGQPRLLLRHQHGGSRVRAHPIVKGVLFIQAGWFQPLVASLLLQS